MSITNFGDRVVIGGNPYVVDLQPGRGAQPDQPAGHGRPAADAGPGAAEQRARPGAPGRDGRPRLRGGRGQVRRNLRVADRGAARGARAATTRTSRTCGRSGTVSSAGSPSSRCRTQQLVDAWKAGFAYTQIDRSGNALDTGTNGYHAEYEHDVVGILGQHVQRGLFQRRPRAARRGRPGGRDQHPVLGRHLGLPVAVGRVRREDRRHEVPRRPLQLARARSGPPRSRASRRPRTIIAADRTGPGGIIGETNDIDANGYWASDNYEALLGLAGYEYLAKVARRHAQEQLGGRRSTTACSRR